MREWQRQRTLALSHLATLTEPELGVVRLAAPLRSSLAATWCGQGSLAQEAPTHIRDWCERPEDAPPHPKAKAMAKYAVVRREADSARFDVHDGRRSSPLWVLPDTFHLRAPYLDLWEALQLQDNDMGVFRTDHRVSQEPGQGREPRRLARRHLAPSPSPPSPHPSAPPRSASYAPSRGPPLSRLPSYPQSRPRAAPGPLRSAVRRAAQGHRRRLDRGSPCGSRANGEARQLLNARAETVQLEDADHRHRGPDVSRQSVLPHGAGGGNGSRRRAVPDALSRGRCRRTAGA